MTAERLPPRPHPSHIAANGDVLQAILSQVRSIADAQLEHADQVGRLLREVAGLRAYIDERLSRMRDSMRPKLDSLHDQEEQVTEVTRYIAGEKHTRNIRAKAIRRILMAAIIGAATAIGGAVGLGALKDCATHTPIKAAP